MENKKTKLTISGSSKKPVKNFDSSRSKGKKTVIIGNQTKKNFSKGSFNKFAEKKSFNKKNKPITNKDKNGMLNGSKLKAKINPKRKLIINR